MLEDESGRVRLVGKQMDEAEGVFVTGALDKPSLSSLLPG
jgi:hypothetical protein